MLTAVEPGREPAAHGPRATAEVVNHQVVAAYRPVRETDTQQVEQVGRPCGGIGAFAQLQPLGRVSRHVIGADRVDALPRHSRPNLRLGHAGQT